MTCGAGDAGSRLSAITLKPATGADLRDVAASGNRYYATGDQGALYAGTGPTGPWTATNGEDWPPAITHVDATRWASQAVPATVDDGSLAKAIATALGISLDELAGGQSRHVDLSGEWWACWQTWKDDQEIINRHRLQVRQRGEDLDVVATTRGVQEPDDGGYLWRGELRIWDNEALMGWYVATEGAVRSKGTMYFALHQHGQRMTGRWVGLSYDGPIVTGWAAMARAEGEAADTMNQLREKGPGPE